MTHSDNIIEVPGMLQQRICNRLVFAEEGLTIEKPLSFNHRIFIASETVAAFRFGVRELKAYKFTFGHQYFIEVKNYNCEITRIKLNSYYGFKRKVYYKVWAELLQNLWDFYMDNQLNYYTELYNIQQMFELAGVTFLQDGICWDKNNKIPWNKIAVKSYKNYFMIHHADNPLQYKCCVFSIEWNAVVLQSLLKDIINEHKRVPRSLRRDI